MIKLFGYYQTMNALHTVCYINTFCHYKPHNSSNNCYDISINYRIHTIRTSIQYTVSDACPLATFDTESLLHLYCARFVAQCILTTAHVIYAFLKDMLVITHRDFQRAYNTDNC